MSATLTSLRIALALTLTKCWQKKGLLSFALLPLAWFYGFLIAARYWLYSRSFIATWRPPIPVVIVGNVTAGGGGKTPTTIALLNHWKSRGITAGVISRGYGRISSACLSVHSGSTASDVGDEPLLIHQKTAAPVVVCADRRLAIETLLRLNPSVQVAICDDGMQRWSLQRDIEITVFASSGLGNGRLLPAGPLREPWPKKTNPLGGVFDIGLSYGADIDFTQERHFKATHRLSDVAVNKAGETLRWSSHAVNHAIFFNQSICALAGIAHPVRFFDMLRQHGLPIAHEMPLPDHVDYTNLSAADQLKIQSAELIFCTEKDAVKLWKIRPDAWAVPLVSVLPADFFSFVDSLLFNLPYEISHGFKTT